MELIKDVSNKEDLEETIIALREVKKSLGLKSHSDLLLLKSDISSIAEQNRQLTVFSIAVSLLTFALPMYFNSLKGLIIGVIKDFKTLISAEIDIFPDEDIEVFASFIIALIAIFFVLLIIRYLQRLLKNTRSLSLLERIIDQIIARRDIWDEVHEIAFMEYQVFLKKNINRFLL